MPTKIVQKILKYWIMQQGNRFIEKKLKKMMLQIKNGNKKIIKNKNTAHTFYLILALSVIIL